MRDPRAIQVLVLDIVVRALDGRPRRAHRLGGERVAPDVDRADELVARLQQLPDIRVAVIAPVHDEHHEPGIHAVAREVAGGVLQCGDIGYLPLQGAVVHRDAVVQVVHGQKLELLLVPQPLLAVSPARAVQQLAQRRDRGAVQRQQPGALRAVRLAQHLERGAPGLLVHHPQQPRYHVLVHVLPVGMEVVPVEPLEPVHGQLWLGEIEVHQRQQRLPGAGEHRAQDLVDLRLARRMGEQQVEPAPLPHQRGGPAGPADERLHHQSGGQLLLLVQGKEVGAGHEITVQVEMTQRGALADGPFLVRDPPAHGKEDVFDAIRAVFLSYDRHACPSVVSILSLHWRWCKPCNLLPGKNLEISYLLESGCSAKIIEI